MIYFDILKQSFEKMNEPKKEKLHKLNKPICPDYFAKAQMINPFNVSFTGNWDRLDTINTPDFRFKNLIS